MSNFVEEVTTMRLFIILILFFLMGCSSEEAEPPAPADTQAKAAESANMVEEQPMQENPKLKEPETPYRYWYDNKVLILSYNHIANDHQSPYTIRPEFFRKHMEFLKNQHFHPLKLEEFYEFMTTGRLTQENAVLITIEDGYESFYWEGYPILKEYEFSAAMFVIYDRLRDSVERKRAKMIPPLTFVQMEEMQKSGLISFQSHTYGLHTLEEHQPATAPEPTEGDQEYRSELFVDFMMSKAALEDLTKQPVLGLSYPYSYYNTKLLQVMKKAGYQYGFTTKSGLVDYNTNPYLLPKNDVGTPEMDGIQFEQRIRSIINRSKGK